MGSMFQIDSAEAEKAHEEEDRRYEVQKLAFSCGWVP